MPELPAESGGESSTPAVLGGTATFGGVTAGMGGGGGGITTGITRAPVNTVEYVKVIRLNRASDMIVANVQGLDVLTGSLTGITPSAFGTAFPSCTIQHQVSTDGVTFYRLSSSTDLREEGAFSVTVTGWPLYALVVTAASSPTTTDVFARVKLNGKSNS